MTGHAPAIRSLREWTTCARCGKRTWRTRRVAKQVARLMRADGESGIRAYTCPGGDGFHVGHKPRAVIAGEATASEWYGR